MRLVATLWSRTHLDSRLQTTFYLVGLLAQGFKEFGFVASTKRLGDLIFKKIQILASRGKWEQLETPGMLFLDRTISVAPLLPPVLHSACHIIALTCLVSNGT